MSRSRSFSRTIFLATGALALITTASAHALTLPRIFSDHMVLQRGGPVKVWGWADGGAEVRVAFGGQEKSATAGGGGRWEITLDAMDANTEPGELTVTSGDDSITIDDVLVGEVWICSGQSNMEWTVGQTDDVAETVAAANLPELRQFNVSQHLINTAPQKDLPGAWAISSPKTVKAFTGVGYHFGRELHEKLKVPVGLINTSWGGTRIEPWTHPSGFSVSPDLKDIAELVAGADKQYRNAVGEKLNDVDAWVLGSRLALEGGGPIPPFPGEIPKHPLANHGRPTAIFNAMMAPLVGYGIRGAIWYQGESNNGEGMLYHEKMKALIGSWRGIWGRGEFPFLFVQLAPYRYGRPDALPGIWEAQLESLHGIPNTGMAVVTDIGNVTDIHPRNKREVGRRLSLWALANTYGNRDLVYSGPLYNAMRVEGDKVVLTFDHAAGLKAADGGALTWFTIAGKDKKFVKAEAEIDGATVVVRSGSVDEPAAVRFAWNEEAEPNLVNDAGLPASPFRTDKW